MSVFRFPLINRLCYVRSVAAAVLSFYAVTLWAIAYVRFSFSVNKQTLQRPFRSKLHECCAHTSHFSPSALRLSLENHEGCWRCFSFPTFESFPQQACVYVFPTFFSSVSTRCAWVLRLFFSVNFGTSVLKDFPASTLGITSSVLLMQGFSLRVSAFVFRFSP